MSRISSINFITLTCRRSARNVLSNEEATDDRLFQDTIKDILQSLVVFEILRTDYGRVYGSHGLRKISHVAVAVLLRLNELTVNISQHRALLRTRLANLEAS